MLLQMSPQRFPLQQFHADEYGFFLHAAEIRRVAKEIKDPAHVGMGNLSSQVDFTLEPRHRVGLGQDFRPDSLDRYALVQFLIFGLIYLAHTPAGDETHNAESPSKHLRLQELPVRGPDLIGILSDGGVERNDAAR